MERPEYLQRKNCPECDTELQVLMFMGRIPEFLVCEKCGLAFPLDGKNLEPVAEII